jgi:hypothetical protein
MMTIKQLKDIIKDLPDDMPFALIDLTTDDFNDCNYPLKKESFEIMDWTEEEDGDPKGKALFIVFENKLNPNPI